VALARALAPEPNVLLLDEPLSNLDPALRERTRRELRTLVHRLDITAVVVTHEQEDAFDLGDRIALLQQGHLEQLGTADELYAAPATAFVARFIGRASEAPAEVSSGTEATVAGVRWPVRWAGPGAAQVGAQARLLARPEGLRLAEPGPGRLHGRVKVRRFTGAVAYFLVETELGFTLEVAGAPGAAREGDAVGVEPTGTGLHLYPVDS
jgi:ABC-type Fe3+/spermidine/putrescine transport system ATPase subunit